MEAVNFAYRQGLRDGLALTERMRSLVEAIREVADGLDTDRPNGDRLDEDRNQNPNEMTDLAAILRELHEVDRWIVDRVEVHPHAVDGDLRSGNTPGFSQRGPKTND